jgi:transposase
MKHIGMDVHWASTDVVVLNERGREVLHRKVETLGPALVELIASIPGEKCVTLEESQLADVVTRALRPHVVEIVRSQPHHNRLISQSETKDDYPDAYRLAQLLYLNQLKAVHHPDRMYQQLREAVRVYWHSSWELTRSKNQLKAFFLYHGIAYEKEEMYAARYREKFQQAVEQSGASQPVRPAVRRLQSIPGIGFIGASTLLAYLEDGWRFHNKRQSWQYANLGVRRHKSDGKGTEGASRRGNRYLKNVLLTAAISVHVSRRETALRRLWTRDVEAGKDPRRVRRTVGRKILAVAQHLLRSHQEYQDELMTLGQ